MTKSLIPLLQALAVVVLWSTSPALVKIGLGTLSPLEIGGIRYFGAFLILAPWLFIRSRPTLKQLSLGAWVRLVIMGLLAYSIGNSLLFYGLKELPTTTTAFILNIIPVATLVLGVIFLNERPVRIQWVGMALALVGGLFFFGPEFSEVDVDAVLISLLGALAITVFGLMGRSFARTGEIDTITLSAIPLGVGGGLLLVIDPPLGLPSLEILGIMLWLAVVNSAIAYLLWNTALKRLQAFEISIVANLMPIGTAFLAPVFLGEIVVGNKWLGILITLIGVVLVGLASEAPRSV